MIPHPTSGLRMLADRVLSSALPALNNQYVMSDTALLGMLVTALAGEMESGISNRVIDINEMKAVFAVAEGEGFAIPDLPDLNLEACTLSYANEVHDQHTRQLMQLHQLVDASNDSLNRLIWQYLEATSTRHVLPI